MCVSVCLSVYLSVSVRLSVCLSLGLFVGCFCFSLRALVFEKAFRVPLQGPVVFFFVCCFLAD